jgi:hypothetical protein
MAFPSFPTQNTADTVAVFDSNFNQLFPDAKIIKVNVKEEAKVMEHPLETGETVSDHAIIQPIEIEMDVFIKGIDYKNTYSIINKLFHDFSLLTVQTNTGTYEKQMISSMPHIESSDIFDGTIINIKMKEALFIEPQYGTVPISPKRPKNKSTNDRGNQNGSDATPRRESELKRQRRLAAG